VTTTLEERVERLEQTVEPLTDRVKQLETWAGPGQNEMFSTNLADLRKRLDNFGKVQSKHTRMLSTLTKDVAGLKTDVATLKTDMVEVKGALNEILDRLPPRPQTPDK
jgi:predicted nuclease with TOPRIM domain